MSILSPMQCRPDLCATDCAVPPRDFLGKFWTDSLVHDNTALELLLAVMGEDRVSWDWRSEVT